MILWVIQVLLALAFLAVGCAVYLTMDRDQMIDLVIDTWHEGPAIR